MDMYHLIEQTACELYVKSGKVKGRDIENWLEAERIVRNRFKCAQDSLDDFLAEALA